MASGALAGTTISDRVYLANNPDEPVVGEVVADNIVDGVKTKGPTFPQSGVDRVEYADAPDSYRSGELHRAQERFEEAVVLYKGAMKSTTARKFWLEQYCRYRIAQCYLEMGSLDEAAAALAELLSNHKQTRFLPDAMLAAGRVQYLKGAYAKAIAEFDKLAAKPWPGWKHRANLWKSKALLAAKKPDDAQRVAQGIIQTASRDRDADIIIQARAIEARVLVAMKKYDDAAGKLNKLIDDIAPAVAAEREGGADTEMQRIEAQCKNALGHCYLEKAKTSKSKEDYRSARLAFLWTVVLYGNFPKERAEALFYAAKCLEKLGDPERANELTNELKDQYPDATFE
jgi:TolA-binding protein